MVSGGCGLDEMLFAFLCEFNVGLCFVVPFPAPSEREVFFFIEKYFFFRVPILMASDGCGLVELLLTLLYFQNSGCDVNSEFRLLFVCIHIYFFSFCFLK